MTVDLFAASFICRDADPGRLFARRGAAAEAAVRRAMSAIHAMMRRMRRLARAGA